MKKEIYFAGNWDKQNNIGYIWHVARRTTNDYSSYFHVVHTHQFDILSDVEPIVYQLHEAEHTAKANTYGNSTTQDIVTKDIFILVIGTLMYQDRDNIEKGRMTIQNRVIIVGSKNRMQDIIKTLPKAI